MLNRAEKQPLCLFIIFSLLLLGASWSWGGFKPPVASDQSSVLHVKDSQATVSEKLKVIASAAGAASPIATVVEHLHRLNTTNGYLSKDRHKVETNSFWLAEYNLPWRIQINPLRGNYMPKLPRYRETLASQCKICDHNIESEKKPNLRAYDFTLNDQKYFLQESPFPMLKNHLVLIPHEHSRMRADQQNVEDGLDFVSQAPEYTFASNSCYFWTGCSIPGHHHYQAYYSGNEQEKPLPIYLASVALDDEQQEMIRYTEDHGVSLSVLHFPAAVVLLAGEDTEAIAGQAGQLIRTWKKKDRNQNTVNLLIRKKGESYEVRIILRSARYRPPKHLLSIKSEPMGWLELAGMLVMPQPKTEKIRERLISEGEETIQDFMRSINPFKNSQAILELVEKSLHDSP
ncbi:DUF4922 domain-containing protein [Parendozoicomonas haliclonae]|uniref:Galactose-1-phosphate uridylyltransferase n=1 Tax=Parendozoicomonas haliclonae TaxID=1960125 RepID=A0A1X7ALP7_9GAMM|nr:DUF4922 domain-containing protein [Parendozoicomonas haliclonae]SMA48596.1 Galactose-1-phosphate uridylyltransferase [Parendozoicomonas haliclonae]